MHSWPRNWVEIGCPVVYHVRTVQSFSAGIKCRHCRFRCIEVSDACAVCKNIAHYRMCMGISWDQFAHSVRDDLNIYYKQFHCEGTPKFQFHIDRISLKWKCFSRGYGRAEGLSLKKLFSTRHKHRKLPCYVQHNLLQPYNQPINKVTI